MIKTIGSILVSFLFVLMSTVAFAQSTADIKIDLIQNLSKDGVIDGSKQNEIIQKYVTQEDYKQSQETAVNEQESVVWKYLTLSNFIKVAGVILLLVALAGFIRKIIRSFWIVIMAIPMIVYQLGLLALSLLMTFRPEVLWESQALYIALMSSITNIIILGWILDSYPKMKEQLKKLFNLGINPVILAAFYMSVYMSLYAYAYNSKIFGSIALFSMFAFVLVTAFDVYRTKIYKGKKELNPNPLMLLMSTTILITSIIAYAFTKDTQFVQTYLVPYKFGLDYMITLGVCGLLVYLTSPWVQYEKYDNGVVDKYKGFYIVALVALTGFSLFAYIMLDSKLLFSFVLLTLYVCAFLHIGHHALRKSYILCAALLGAALYGTALSLEHFGQYLVFIQ